MPSILKSCVEDAEAHPVGGGGSVQRMFREETVHIQSHKGFTAQCVDKPLDKQCLAKKVLGIERACEETGVSSKEGLCFFVCLFFKWGM